MAAGNPEAISISIFIGTKAFLGEWKLYPMPGVSELSLRTGG